MNERFLITGLAGKHTLKGSIKVGGAKNAALKAMAASVLFKDELTLKNVPSIEDIHRMGDLLEGLGSTVEAKKSGVYKIKTDPKSNARLCPEISKRMRASVVLTGPLLARFGHVEFPHPGGCVIGERPIDVFIEGFKKMGAAVRKKGTSYVVDAEGGRLKGAEIFLKVQSVTATETFLMAAVLARGTTVIKNAATEPEIEDLALFLKKCGARIGGIGTTTLTIEGGAPLLAKGKAYETVPDRIEAGSFIILAALAGRDVTITHCEPEHLESLTDALARAGVHLEIKKNSVRVLGSARKLKAVNIKTHEYPGFPTDLQAPMTVFLTQAVGESLVFETIFEGRLNYTESLNAMGADVVMMDPHRVIVRGSTSLHGKNLESPDLRAGLAFIIAAIVAKGDSVIHNVYNIDRGYERIEERLAKIGVSITRVN